MTKAPWHRLVRVHSFRAGREAPSSRLIAAKILEAWERRDRALRLEGGQELLGQIEKLRDDLRPEIVFDFAVEEPPHACVITFASPRSSDDFLERAYCLSAEGAEMPLLDFIYDTLDDLLLDERLSECDALIARVDETRLCAVGLIGLLTVSASASRLLPSRADLFGKVRDRLTEDRGQRETDELLRGLE